MSENEPSSANEDNYVPNVCTDAEPIDIDLAVPDPEDATPPQCDLPAASIISKSYIKLVPHLHDKFSATSYISLDGGATPEAEAKPWAPFRTRADFEYAESVVSNMERKWVNTQLSGMRGSWSDAPSASNITFKNYDHMEKTLATARTYVAQKAKLKYRDPWKWIDDLLSDLSLSSDIHWYPAQKFLCEDGVTTQLFDEPYTSGKWYKIQGTLPQVRDLPHCYVLMALWLDKGMVTKRIRKHPIILRPLFLNGNIRNASGNGGGVLVGYMIIPIDPSDLRQQKCGTKHDWARFRRELMHKAFKIIFGSLIQPAKHGEALTCGDNILRVCYPGIPITSIDGEEACSVSACAPVGPLSVPAVSETMKRFYEDAMAAPTKTESERIFQSVGLHATENFFWSLPNSDPYSANSYDLLHSDESGKWGKHLWPLLLDALKTKGYKGRLTMNMGKVPRWWKLKHFPNVTTEDYTDGQAFLDILKCILPCIVQLLPSNSALVHCIRAYQQYRFMLGLKCLSTTRTGRLREYLGRYEKYCKLVAKEYGKNFAFYKQHATAHAIEDVHEKGPPTGYSTRPGEGFHQEVKEAYAQTNGRNVDPQLTRIDENKEAFARIRMSIDTHDALCRSEEDGDSDEFENGSDEGADSHWALGSPLPWTTPELMQHALQDKKFAANLRTFLNDFVLDQPLLPNDVINVKQFRCIRLRYQSLEDWTEAVDILRCNPRFFNNRRYDYVIINDDPGDLTFAHLVEVFRCKLPDESLHDIALVNMLKRSKWMPKTKWAGCKVYEEQKATEFVMLKYLVRGAHMIQVFETNKPSLTFLNDLVDGDIFLRAGN
ncbi:hypothetical protein B0H17DRAFT_1215217 [Mycena rosella]|uniref:Uncharacterized protein n=1 Tax=Mycena rosella TaxID=1033263 RepID=A0AAD7CL32_MYCRO|nr:hypothetical protein B0H17DRAFT_1215217 [Mycena rosella]